VWLFVTWVKVKLADAARGTPSTNRRSIAWQPSRGAISYVMLPAHATMLTPAGLIVAPASELALIAKEREVVGASGLDRLLVIAVEGIDPVGVAEADLAQAESALRMRQPDREIDILARQAISSGAKAEDMALVRKAGRERREEIERRDAAVTHVPEERSPVHAHLHWNAGPAMPSASRSVAAIEPSETTMTSIRSAG